MRAGAGVVRLIGRPEDRWLPEAVFGTDLSLKINDRQAIVGTADYYPRIDKWSEYRIRARLAYQIVLDPQTCTTLRFGIQERYDSNPGTGTKRNDLTYFATLGFSF